MGPRRSGHSLSKQPGVQNISSMAHSVGGHHSSSKNQRPSPKSNEDKPYSADLPVHLDQQDHKYHQYLQHLSSSISWHTVTMKSERRSQN